MNFRPIHDRKINGILHVERQLLLFVLGQFLFPNGQIGCDVWCLFLQLLFQPTDFASNLCQSFGFAIFQLIR